MNPLAEDADDDPDGDGLTNLQEYELGTDPRGYNPIDSLDPNNVVIECRSVETTRPKCGLAEYCDPSWPPKYYLSEHGTWEWERTSYPNVNFPIRVTYDYTLDYNAVSMVSTASVTDTMTHADGIGGCTTYTFHDNNLPSCGCASPCDTYDWDTITSNKTHVYKYQYDIEDHYGWYLDCSGCFPGPGYRTATCNHTIFNEYTTSMLLANAVDDLNRCGSLSNVEWGQGRAWAITTSVSCAASTSASRDLSTNEYQVSLAKIGYRFKMAGLQMGQIYRLNWTECFTTEGSSTAAVLRTRNAVIRGNGGTQYIESASYVIDPPQTDGVIEPVVFKVELKEPDGLPVETVTPPDRCFRSAGPWCFEWQYVHPTKVVVPYSQAIEGLVEPLGPHFGYYWSVTAGTLSGADTATPTFDASSMSLPSTMSEITLTLCPKADCSVCSTNRTLEVYRDHLERDRENFPVGTDCGHQNFSEYWWTFNRYGKTWYCNRKSWNCFGSVWHAYDGSGDGYSTPVPGFSITVVDDEPIDWATALSGVQRGDFISYWLYNSGTGTELMQHAATFVDSSSTYGANNFPSWGLNPPRDDGHGHGGVSWWGTSWEWWGCSAQTYYNNVNADYQLSHPGEFLVNRIKIHKR